MHVVYIDSLFLTNFALNYVILRCTARLCGISCRRTRIAAGAAVGGAYAVASAFPALGFCLHPACKLAAAVLMVMAAFGGQERLLRITLVFLAAAAAFGGVVLAVSMLDGGANGAPGTVSWRVLFLSFAVTYGVLSLVFRQMARRRDGGGTAAVSITLGGRSTSLTALRDTGNSLCDPLTGRRVIVCEAAAVGALFNDRTREKLVREKLERPADLLEELRGSGYPFSLIPFTAVGTEAGLLLSFRPDEVMINGKDTDSLIALSPNPVSNGGAYSAIAGVS